LFHHHPRQPDDKNVRIKQLRKQNNQFHIDSTQPTVKCCKSFGSNAWNYFVTVCCECLLRAILTEAIAAVELFICKISLSPLVTTFDVSTEAMENCCLKNLLKMSQWKTKSDIYSKFWGTKFSTSVENGECEYIAGERAKTDWHSLRRLQQQTAWVRSTSRNSCFIFACRSTNLANLDGQCFKCCRNKQKLPKSQKSPQLRFSSSTSAAARVP